MATVDHLARELADACKLVGGNFRKTRNELVCDIDGMVVSFEIVSEDKFRPEVWSVAEVSTRSGKEELEVSTVFGKNMTCNITRKEEGILINCSGDGGEVGFLFGGKGRVDILTTKPATTHIQIYP